MALYPVFAVGDPVRYQVAGASGPYGPVRQLEDPHPMPLPARHDANARSAGGSDTAAHGGDQPLAERIRPGTCSSSSMLHPDRSVLAGETLDREGRVRVYFRLQ